MHHTYQFTRVSNNAKTGPIPVTTTSSDSCPPTCSFKGAGCYAENGNLAIHWRAVTAGKRGGTLAQLCAQIEELPRGQLWRHNQAGDLPAKKPGLIDPVALLQLAAANAGRRGFTYTHYKPTHDNLAALRLANDMGFTINLSAETLAEADEYAETGLPVVVVLPIDQTTSCSTPAGRHVSVCPAAVGNTDCLNCGICQQRDRQAIVGFPAHGQSAARVQKIFFMKDKEYA